MPAFTRYEGEYNGAYLTLLHPLRPHLPHTILLTCSSPYRPDILHIVFAAFKRTFSSWTFCLFGLDTVLVGVVFLTYQFTTLPHVTDARHATRCACFHTPFHTPAVSVPPHPLPTHTPCIPDVYRVGFISDRITAPTGSVLGLSSVCSAVPGQWICDQPGPMYHVLVGRCIH